MIKIGDTFKADDYTWEFINKDPIGIAVFSCESLNRTIRFIYENDYTKFNENRWAVFEYVNEQGLSQDEMRMCIEIIDKLKGEVK